jgi:hypothetical protein
MRRQRIGRHKSFSPLLNPIQAHFCSKKQLPSETDSPITLQVATETGIYAMFRSILMLSALAAAPAFGASYSAKLASPTNERFIARDIVWACGADACQGATEESRPVVLCESLARHAGRVDSFLVDGRAFSAAELDRCNASAKPSPSKALASQ